MTKRKPAGPRQQRPPQPQQQRRQSLISEQDLYLFNEGSHFRLYRHLGAHPDPAGDGTYFAVWAPNAERVSVIGDFNGWDGDAAPLEPRGDSGIWEGFVRGIGRGALYKFRIHGRDGFRADKADPFGYRMQHAPETASIVWDLGYEWQDRAWLQQRAGRDALHEPMSVYELHLGSWRRVPEEGDRPLTYRELAPLLVEHLRATGFTHVELMPVMEHPFYGSWGYQVGGYFAATSRYGTPQDLMFLIDTLHQAGFGVILDWVPAHFPTDEAGLVYFDGTHLFEHADPRQGRQPDWGTCVFNYGRREVVAFLISNALFWLEQFHADGLRVDAVASMLYLDYSRQPGEWIPNEHGGRENLHAIAFLRRLNETVYAEYPGVQTIAEESTAWPMVSRPVWLGGLGFGFKWDMGWMHDTLSYVQQDPVHRSFAHDRITFRLVYAFQENFVLPLSHDEVVHGKGSLLGKMPGDEWQQFANLRLLLALQFAQPGKKLLFMGGELAQQREWNHDTSLDWHLLQQPAHAGILRLVHDLNRLYRELPELHELDAEPRGFEWLEPNDYSQSCFAFLRRDRRGRCLLVAVNATPVPRPNYRIGVPAPGRWEEILNTDAHEYGGSGQGNLGGVETGPVRHRGRAQALSLLLPPLGVVFLAQSDA